MKVFAFLSSVGNLVNFSKSDVIQAFHHLVLRSSGIPPHFAYTGVGYCFHSLKGLPEPPTG